MMMTSKDSMTSSTSNFLSSNVEEEAGEKKLMLQPDMKTLQMKRCNVISIDMMISRSLDQRRTLRKRQDCIGSTMVEDKEEIETVLQT